MKAKSQSISFHYNKAVALAQRDLMHKAKKALRNNAHLDEFIMGMGRALFTGKDGETVESRSREVRSVFSFLSKWDDYLHLTGMPVRLKAKGKPVYNW